MSDIKPLQAEVKIVDNASRAFDSIRESILGASGALSSFLQDITRYDGLNIKPLSLSAKIDTVTENIVRGGLDISPVASEPIEAMAHVAPELPVPDATAFRDAFESIQNEFSELSSGMITNIGQIQEVIHGTLGTIGDGVSSIGGELAGLDSGLNSLGSSISKTTDSLGGIGGKGKTGVDDAGESMEKLKMTTRAVGDEATKAGLSLASIGQAYWGVMGIMSGIGQFRGVFNASDRQARFRARLGLLSEEQRGSAYAGKEDGRGYSVHEIDSAFGSTANRLGVDKNRYAEDTMMFMTGTGGAFDNIGEASDFTELLSKQFSVSGASSEQAAGAMEQLRQGMSKGALDMQDFKSIMSSAPQLGELMAKKLEISVSELNQAVTDRRVTGDVLKGALFDNADMINEQFEKLPMTWERVTATMKNRFLEDAQPILDKIGEIASSEPFEKLIEAVFGLGSILIELADLLFSVFEPIVPVFTKILAPLSFMVSAIRENIVLFGALAGSILAVAAAYYVITNFQRIVIALQKIMAATNPFLLIATAIVVAIVALKHLWDTNMDFQFAVKKGWLQFKTGFEVMIVEMKALYHSMVGNFLEGIANILVSWQDAINKIIDGINRIKKEKIEHVTFGDDVMATSQEFYLRADGFSQQSGSIQRDLQQSLLRLEEEKAEAIKRAAENAEKADKPSHLAFGETPSKPLHTKGNTRIDKDSIQLLKDIASVELVNRYTTIRPKVRVNVGTINNEADADAFFERFAGEVESANASSLSEVYA